MLTKEFKAISWLVPESEYREDKALSYSTLSTYEKGGFYAISTLSEKKESPSLLLGSIVDCIITDGENAFNESKIGRASCRERV